MGAEHAFCVVDDLIFDSTQAFASTFSKDSLDWIYGKSRCDHIHFAVRFQTNFNTKQNWRERLYYIRQVNLIEYIIISIVSYNRIHHPSSIFPISGDRFLSFYLRESLLHGQQLYPYLFDRYAEPFSGFYDKYILASI